MRIIFFLEMFKIESRFLNGKKNEEKSFMSEIIASKDVAINYLY